MNNDEQQHRDVVQIGEDLCESPPKIQEAWKLSSKKLHFYCGWEDPDFLKESEEEGVTIDVEDGDTKAIELNLIRVKNAPAASELNYERLNGIEPNKSISCATLFFVSQ